MRHLDYLKKWAVTTRDRQGNTVYVSFHRSEQLARRGFNKRKKLGYNEPLYVERNYTEGSV